jgi:hypothetical protein
LRETIREDQVMSEQAIDLRYEDWPADQEQREELAREVFGRHVVSAYDGLLDDAAEMLYKGWRYKMPTEEQQRFLDWIASLTDEERHCAFEFARDMVHGVVFAILHHIDGTAGCKLQDTVWEKLRVVVEIYSQADDPLAPPGEPLEALTVNSPSSTARGIQLYHLWYEWLEKYSRWQKASKP